jgi:lambda family phage portal protein
VKKKLNEIGKVKNMGYGDAGASQTKRSLKGFTATSMSPVEDIDANNYTMRQRARMLYMSAPVATSAIKTNRTNTIGLGLRLNPKVDIDVLGITSEEAEAWEKDVKAEFALWAEDKNACDAIGLNDFYELQQLAFTSWLISGDVFALKTQVERTRFLPYGLRINIIEADRIATPMSSSGISVHYTEGETKAGNAIHDGVEVDKAGKVIAYHIRSTYPYQVYKNPTTWTRVEAYGKETGLPNIIHVMAAERPGQYRGVSYLAPVIESLLQIKRYTESELTAALVESFFTAFVKTEAETDIMPMNEVGEQGESQASYDPNEYEMGPGQINVMNPGESIELADPKRPASGFEGFVHAISVQIGSALEIPAEMLLKEFTSSYSASRAALLEAWKSFRMYRKWFTSDFCEPVYKLWLCEAVALGRVKAPGFFSDPKIQKAWLGAEWVGPSQGQLDPVKEMTAEIMGIENGFTTNKDATIKLTGGDWNANMNQLERENKRKKEVLQNEEIAPAQNKITKATIINTIKDAIKEEVQNAEDSKS